MHIKVEDGSGDSGEEEDQEAHHPARQAAASHRPARQAAAAALRHQLPDAGGHGLVEQYPSYIRDLTKFQEENARLVTREVGLVHQPRDPVPGGGHLGRHYPTLAGMARMETSQMGRAQLQGGYHGPAELHHQEAQLLQHHCG